MKILIADKFGPDLPVKLAKYGEVVEADLSHLPTADVVLVRSMTRADKAYIDRAENLKLIIRGGVGIDNIDLEYCRQKGILVRNTPEASAVAVAELAMAMMLAIVRHVVPAHNGTRSGQWLKKELKGTELCGKTLGLIGVGRIGTEVGRRAQAFGMKVIAARATAKPHEIAEVVDLDTLLAESDFISLHIPLTHETIEIINTRTIGKMKDGVILINTARGKHVNEADLAAALKSGKVRYAALDVYQSEPPTGSPLLDCDNVLLTPHLGASTEENMARIGEIIEQQIGDFVAGKLESL